MEKRTEPVGGPHAGQAIERSGGLNDSSSSERSTRHLQIAFRTCRHVI